MRRRELIWTTLVLSACSGSSDTPPKPDAAVTPMPDAGPPAPAIHTLNLPNAPWFPEPVDFDGTGDEVLVTPTMGDDLHLTPPTPVFILGFPEGGALTDLSSSYFAEQPIVYGVKNVVHADFDGSGREGLFFCSMGREVGDPTPYTSDNPPTPPIYGDQNRIFFWVDGKLTDVTTKVGLPMEHDYCHGASAVDVDKSGKASILVHNISAPYPPGLPHEYLLKLVGGTYQIVDLAKPLADANDPLIAIDGDFYSAAGKFTADGYGDLVLGHTVFHGDPGPTYVQSRKTLAVTAVEMGHDNHWQGRLVADLNGSGLPGLLKEESNDGTTSNFLAHGRYSYFLNDGHGNLTDASDRFPANLGPNDFAQDMRALDVEFKGCPDVVPTHNQYIFNDPNPKAQSHPNVLLANDCTGRLTKAVFDDPVFKAYSPTKAASYQLVYFIRTANPKLFHVIYANYDGTMYERAVTPDFPLHITPIPAP